MSRDLPDPQYPDMPRVPTSLPDRPASVQRPDVDELRARLARLTAEADARRAALEAAAPHN